MTGDWIGSGVFFHAPLYPYFLGLLYATFGRSLLLIKVLQILLGGLACLLIAETGRNLISRKTGLIAGLLAAFYLGSHIL